MQLDEFGRLPVVYEGRVKPLDTVARNMLRYLSGKQTYVDKDGKTQPAIKWFLDVAAGDEDSRKDKVFRIENIEVLEMLGLKRRAGLSLCHSMSSSKQLGRVGTAEPSWPRRSSRPR